MDEENAVDVAPKEKPKRHLTEEHKRNISNAKKGHPVSEETRAKQRAATLRQMESGNFKSFTKEDNKKCIGKAFKGSPERSLELANKMADSIGRERMAVDTVGDGTARSILSSIKYAFALSVNIDRNNPQTMMDALGNLIAYCAENDVKVTNTLCYLACNVSNDDITSWACGVNRSSDPRYKDFAVTLRRVCSTFREQLATDAKINPVLAIWWQKIYDGYREDKIQVGEAPTENKLTAEQIKEKYKDMPD